MKLRLTNHLLCFITPILSGSVLTTLPSLAATLASSEATVNIGHFSHNPWEVRTLTDANTFTLAPSSGSVTAQADANATANFDPNDLPEGFSNFSLSRTSGQGSTYLGQAQSLAAVIGYDFLVEKGETFYFDFDAFLNLETSIDKPQFEAASAAGELSFELRDSTNGSVLDYFALAGNLTTPGVSDFIDFEKSTNITFNPTKTFLNKSFGGTQEVANASVNGRFSRSFNSLTYLTLVEVKTNEATVKAPESSSIIALLFFCLIGVGYGVRGKAFGTRSKITQQHQLTSTHLNSKM